MEHLVRSLKLAWRSERLLKQNEFQITKQKILLNGLAGLVAVFGLVMLSLAVFFALVPVWGQPLAALAVGGVDLVLAGVLVAYAGSLKPGVEVEMVKEVRDMAMSDVEAEIALAEEELVALRDDVRSFVRNPVDALLPAAIGPLLGAVTRGVVAAKKK
ncbi:conserved hypothetical protein [gamma proteobacterium NOR5-3]|nr:conserved hypothetical protein [gamma proteobacterium NOR5-3]